MLRTQKITTQKLQNAKNSWMETPKDAEKYEET
jgi:hypothetical protein